ncbi:MAG: hypothetical protein KIT33_11140 [Candidatus Kapabacteria bacterium]|nr:hypothetical protein [Ignavibacteriota bacterium]MCW5885512.1 hypothetical protein [Candidatus Kapabacteria bacterium]
MFKILVYTSFLMLISVSLFSQDNVGIGTTSPDPSAILELNATDKGFLPPRMNQTQRDAIASPATGLVIYNSTSVRYEYYNGTSWVALLGVSSIGLSAPSEISVSNSPLTANGTIQLEWTDQNQNLIFASPNGSTGIPTFRALTQNDIPNLSTSKITAGNWQVLYSNGSGTLSELPLGANGSFLKSTGTASAPNFSVLSDTDIPNLDVTKITTGLLPVERGGTGVGDITGMLRGNGTGAISAVTNTAGNVAYWANANQISGMSDLTWDDVNSILTVDGVVRHFPLGAEPGSPAKGMTYFNDTDNKLFLYNGSNWIDLGASGSGSLPPGTTNQTLRYGAADWEATSLLRATATNVAIGETSFTPNSLLHTDAGNATAHFHKFTAGTTTGTTAGDGFDIGVDGSGNAIVNQQENLPLIISTNNTERMRINGGDGGVRINVSTASNNTLNINNTTPASVAMTLTHSGASSGSRFSITGDGTLHIRQIENDPMLFFTNDAERMRISADGKVGIGEIAPGTKLHINGGVVFSPVDNSNSSITVGDRSYIKVSNDGSITLTGGVTGQFLVLQKTGSGTTTLADGSGTKLTGNWEGSIDDTITLIFDGSDWVELSRSNN